MARAAGGVRVEGLNKVVRGLQSLGLEVEDLKDAFSKISAEASTLIAHLAPHVTGNLARSVRGNRAKAKAVVRAGRAAVPYAGPINYGWPARNIAPDLFMQRGEEQYIPTAVHRLEQELQAAINRKGLR